MTEETGHAEKLERNCIDNAIKLLEIAHRDESNGSVNGEIALLLGSLYAVKVGIVTQGNPALVEPALSVFRIFPDVRWNLLRDLAVSGFYGSESIQVQTLAAITEHFSQRSDSERSR